MIQMLVGPIANVAGQFLKNRAEKVKAKQELAVAKIQAQTKKVQSDANWEEKAIDASQDSIKDELWTVLFIGLIIGCCLCCNYCIWEIRTYGRTQRPRYGIRETPFGSANIIIL